ncbi:MAG: HAD-IIIA family hydrolase [Pontibacterium sp.]
MYKALIFDWDGTVINSTARIVSSMQKASLSLSLEPLSADAVKNIIGLGLPEAIRTLMPGIADNDLEQMKARYSQYYLSDDDTPAQLFDGAHESLTRLKEQGYTLAIATGKSRKGLDRVLAETDTDSLFSITRCADETQSKPHPQMLHEILTHLSLTPNDTLMVGDTEYDLEMGQRAGMHVVATSYGAHAVERLLPYEPKLVMNKFVDLENWLLK